MLTIRTPQDLQAYSQEQEQQETAEKTARNELQQSKIKLYQAKAETEQAKAEQIRRKTAQAEQPTQDSFLFVVALLPVLAVAIQFILLIISLR